MKTMKSKHNGNGGVVHNSVGTYVSKTLMHMPQNGLYVCKEALWAT